MDTQQEKRIVTALESIEKSLRVLAEDAKASKELKTQMLSDFEGLQSSIQDLKDNPFWLKQTNLEGLLDNILTSFTGGTNADLRRHVLDELKAEGYSAEEKSRIKRRVDEIIEKQKFTNDSFGLKESGGGNE